MHKQAATARQPETHEPVTFTRLKAASERNLRDRLEGRSVCFVLDDQQFDLGREFIAFTVESGLLPRLRLANWSSLLEILPALKADVLVINSIHPELLSGSFGRFESGLREFRNNNPGAAVTMMNVYPFTPAGKQIRRIQSEGLIDRSDGVGTTPAVLIQNCAAVLEAKL